VILCFVTLQSFFTLKQEHYTLKKVGNVKMHNRSSLTHYYVDEFVGLWFETIQSNKFKGKLSWIVVKTFSIGNSSL